MLLLKSPVTVFALLTVVSCNEAADAPEAHAAAAAEVAPKPVRSVQQRSEAGPRTRLTLAAGGLEPRLTFGTSMAKVTAAVEASVGPPSVRQHNNECGEGPMDFVRFKGLSLSFQGDRFVGWSLSEAQPRLRTAGGLAVGASGAALSSARIEESTLGEEFDVEGVGGLLEGQGKKITALWAGSVCHFR